MTKSKEGIEARVERLHASGIIDMHFDLPMDLCEKRAQPNVLATEFLPQFEAGGMGLIGAAIYIEDRYLPERGLQVALDQIARLYTEAEQSKCCVVCRSHQEISSALDSKKVGFLITMEGVEPLGDDLDLLRAFYELGLRAVGLTHARTNAAGHGGIFAASGSSPEGLTPFGGDVVRECERLGIIVDLAHINPAGFKEIVDLTTKPLVVSHTNSRKFYDVERNISDEQINMIGQRRGVIGINSVLVNPKQKESTLDRYVDHIEHVANLIGMDCVGIGFDFFEFIYRQWPESKKKWMAEKLTTPHFIPDLTNHSHARNLTRKLIERGFSDNDLGKILRDNWMRIFEELL
ncbi:MAG TPA: membrane dipeptidase [Chthoniobacterales bacterium]|nr:membrane dipeptidase [Chthoniobacterales bacterium]